jgi:hypothetical protein
MLHLTPIRTARAIEKLEENWSLAAVARELHCSKTCIFNIKSCWQENRLERPIRIGVGKVSLLKFTFILIMYSGTSLTRTSKGPKIKFELRKIRVTEKYIQLRILNLLCMYVIYTYYVMHIIQYTKLCITLKR